MILKAEPRTVMRFVEDNFEVLRRLYRVQLKENLIPADSFAEITRHKGDIVTRRLTAFKILRATGDDYRLDEAVAAYLGFLTREFKPLLPEQLRRYHASIQDVYELLTIRAKLDDQTRALRLEHLYNEVQSFLDNVTNNTFTLLKRTQRLKVNRHQLSYAARVREARLLIEQYIDPLTRIVNLNDANSIASLLRSIGREINLDRMAPYPPSVIERYEQLDNLLRQVHQRLQRESDVIRRELTPLIDRIRRESEVLGGWLIFLDRPLLHPVPDFSKRNATTVFGDQTEADLKMYLEQFSRTQHTAPISLTDRAATPAIRLLDRRRYRRRLQAALPLADFFDWSLAELAQTGREPTARDLFELTSLLFGGEDRFVLAFAEGRRTVAIDGRRYTLPTVSVATKTVSP